MAVIGIIGGGQLGRMICFEAHKMGFKTLIFSDHENSPACQVSNNAIIGDYLDFEKLTNFCEKIDFATFEFENVPYETASFIEKKVPLFPNANILKITQNRILEKQFLNSHKIETAKYKIINNFDELLMGFKEFNKSILKTAIMGYDGKGQCVIEDENQAKIAYNKLKSYPLILEKFSNFTSEGSIIVARNKNNEIVTYDPLTNIHKSAILHRSIYPSILNISQISNVKLIAKKIAQALDLIGILAIEFFVENDKIIVNELAPRPHNSGHFSMNASYTSQFEQLIRAIANISLGNTEFYAIGEMINILGFDINFMDKYYKNPHAKIHLYGKNEVVEGRKMGHVNLIKT